MKNIITALSLLACLQLHAQNSANIKQLLIDPAETGAGIEKMHTPHVAMYDTKANNHKLFLMIVGTGGSATETKPIDSAAATMGYHVIGLDYKNNVITTVCNNSLDEACFDHFRAEIMFGTPVSDSVNVDSNNSIINRFNKVLAYLVKNDAQGGWGAFYKNGKITWSSVVVGGHSQGAGHAAYIGQHFSVSRVLIFSGPQDYRAAFKSPALWLSAKSITPPSKYYAFLHLKDPFDVTHQLANCNKLMRTAQPDSVMIQPGVPLNTHKHILVNNIEGNAHMSTVQPVFRNVWEYMLRE